MTSDELIRETTAAIAAQFALKGHFEREALANMLRTRLGLALEVAAEAKADHLTLTILRRDFPQTAQVVVDVTRGAIRAAVEARKEGAM